MVNMMDLKQVVTNDYHIRLLWWVLNWIIQQNHGTLKLPAPETVDQAILTIRAGIEHKYPGATFHDPPEGPQDIEALLHGITRNVMGGEPQ